MFSFHLFSHLISLLLFQREEKESPLTLDVSYDDAGKWPENISASIRQKIVLQGPIQIKDIDFPANKVGRRFTTNNYVRKMSNGETISRNWLIYSIDKNAIFCFCCRLFSTVQMSLSSSVGFCDWRHMSKLLQEHEQSPSHMKAYQSWMEHSNRIRSGKSIDSENQRIIRNEAERWKDVLKRLIYITEFLGAQNLAFRGQKDTLFDRSNGNFLKLIEFISKFDLVLSDHVRRIKNKETHVHYLGKNIQNEIIDILASNIKDKIITEMSTSKYYSVILDCTPDVSHIEQMTLIMRFVKYASGEKAVITEHFLGFIPVNDTSGDSLTNILIKQLEELKIPFNNLRGQGYDNGANMKGKKSGVQKRILDLNPRAFFVPCGAHSLNLVVNDAALCSKEAVSFFGIIQELYNFFAASTHRWEVLQKNVINLTLKPLSQTRWESRIEAVLPFRYQLGEIYDSLYELSEDERLDAYGKNTAANLAKQLTNYKFICCLILWHLILFRVNLISKKLQEVETDIVKALELICTTKEFFEELRTDEGFEKILVDSREVAESVDVNPTFPPEIQLRPRRIKKQFSYESVDESVLDPKLSFKTNFFFCVLDQCISSLDERFTQLQDHNKIFGFLYPKSKINDDEEILKCCKNLHQALSDGKHSDIDGIQLYQELKMLKSIFSGKNKEENKSPLELLNFITENGYTENFPNITVALRILLTLPVSVATGERSFSKLKIIKNYLRSSMSQERLVGLALMSIEFSVLEEIDIESIITEFANRKARKVNLYG